MGILQEFSLSNKVALVTGASGHIGRKTCAYLAELGANLVLVDRDQDALGGLRDELCSQYDVDVQVIVCDLESESSRTNLHLEYSRGHSRLDVLIHLAAFVGTAELTGWAVPFEQQELGTWRRAIEVNLTSMFHLAQLFSPELSAADTASIIAVGSIYAKFAPDWSLYDGTAMGNPAAYSASKAGLLQLTRWLATTLPPSVRVNSISPGGVFRSQSQEFVSRYERKVPMGRMATEDDVARAILFLATPLSSYVTGQDLAVDGGWGV